MVPYMQDKMQTATLLGCLFLLVLSPESIVSQMYDYNGYYQAANQAPYVGYGIQKGPRSLDYMPYGQDYSNQQANYVPLYYDQGQVLPGSYKRSASQSSST